MNTQELEQEFNQIIEEFLDEINLDEGSTIILGCSTSEVAGGIIGKAYVPQIGEIIISELLKILKPLNINLAVQCCEHLNRALVIEKSVAKSNNFETVFVIPKENAGEVRRLRHINYLKIRCLWNLSRRTQALT